MLTPKVDFENGVLEPDHHREIRTQNTLVEVEMVYGLTDKVTLVWELPLINDRDHEHFDEVGTPGGAFHPAGRDLRFRGCPRWRAVRACGEVQGYPRRWSPREIPNGPYRLRDSEGEINEPTIQPGTGSTDVTVSLLYSRQVVPLKAEWFVSGAYRANGENDLDYRFGDEVQASAGFRYKTDEQVTWSLHVNGRRTGRDDFLGSGVPSTRSTLVNLTPGLKFETSTGTSIYGFVQVPVYEKVNEVNLAPCSGLLMGISHVF